MPSNTAAWQVALRASPLEIKPSTYRSPGENEILVKTKAVAFNPADWKLQKDPPDLLSWVQFPIILGEDVAGEVVEVGTGDATRFKIGDRVVGFANGIGSKDTTQGAFQDYVILPSTVSCVIPDDMPYENAVVLPLGLATAAAGVFPKDQLALPYPSSSPEPSGKTVLVWGGMTSVGCNAIQLIRAAGYEVIATASPKNFEYIKKLGASQVFDYKSETVVDDIVAAFEGKESAGTIACAPNTVDVCATIMQKVKGRNFIASAGLLPEKVPDDVEARMINSFLFVGELGQTVMRKYLPEALASGHFVPAPTPQVVGNGLEHIQTALDILEKGAAGKKLVVTL